MRQSGTDSKPSAPRTILSVSISLGELEEIDAAAHEKHASRSEFMRDASLEKARRINQRAEKAAV